MDIDVHFEAQLREAKRLQRFFRKNVEKWRIKYEGRWVAICGDRATFWFTEDRARKEGEILARKMSANVFIVESVTAQPYGCGWTSTVELL